MAAQREWLEKDYYQVLGVASTATDKEITRAYRKLAKQFHPDANPGSEDRFKEISAAYDVLGDDAKRKEYDEVRRLGPAGFGGFGGPGGTGGAGGATFRIEDLGDLGDLFGGLGATFGGGGRRARNAGPRRGADVEAELHLSFEDAVRGATTSVNVAGEARCETCNGSGAAPGSSPVTCPTCHGRGALDDNQGLFSLSRVCPQCSGRGTVIEKPCQTCHGTGVVRRTRQVKVRIPAGVEDGQRIRVKGRGAPGRGQRARRRPLRDRAGGQPSPLRPPGPQPDPDRAGDVPRGGAGLDGAGADPRRARDAAGAGRHVLGAGRSGSRAAASPATAAARPATCSSPSRWPCPRN